MKLGGAGAPVEQKNDKDTKVGAVRPSTAATKNGTMGSPKKTGAIKGGEPKASGGKIDDPISSAFKERKDAGSILSLTSKP